MRADPDDNSADDQPPTVPVEGGDPNPCSSHQTGHEHQQETARADDPEPTMKKQRGVLRRALEVGIQPAEEGREDRGHRGDARRGDRELGRLAFPANDVDEFDHRGSDRETDRKVDGQRMKATEESPPSIVTHIGLGERHAAGEWFEEIDERGHMKIEQKGNSRVEGDLRIPSIAVRSEQTTPRRPFEPAQK